ncbi:MAG: F0F1 ATP synthase subunit delta [Patescibacteria group bacterium]
MATLSNNDIARAIYLVSKDKTHTELHDVNKKVVEFLARRQLLSKTPDILERLDKIINYESEKIVVKVSSARKLKEELKKELIFFLKKRYKVKEVVLTETLDEKLLGGVRLEINDEIIDLTVKNKIKKLQEHLIRKI